MSKDNEIKVRMDSGMRAVLKAEVLKRSDGSMSDVVRDAIRVAYMGKLQGYVVCRLHPSLYDKLTRLAETSGLEIGEYARKAIIRALQGNIRFQEVESGSPDNPWINGSSIAEIPPVISVRAAEEEGQYQSQLQKGGKK